MQTFAEAGITDGIANILAVLTQGISFLTGNAWMLILVGAPIVIGILGAILSIFRH